MYITCKLIKINFWNLLRNININSFKTFWGGVNRVWRWFIRRRLCGAQLPSFIYWWCRHTRSSVKVKRDDGRIRGWGGGGGVESNLPSKRAWTRSDFNFNSGGCNFILRPTLLILEPFPPPPSLQIIIAQSLTKPHGRRPGNIYRKTIYANMTNCIDVSSMTC